MNTTIQPIFKFTLTAAALTYAIASSAANKWEGAWVNGDNILDPGTVIQSIAANANKNSYTGNSALLNNAWGMQGTWLSFQLPSTTSILVSLSSATTNAPGFTIYRTDGRFAGDGAGVADSVTNGAIHSFNQVAQAGTAGIVWATDNSVTSSLAGNTTANGIVETLGYVNASGIDYVNAFGESVKSGAYDLSIDNLYENGVFGNIGASGGMNYANLTLINLAAGYYTIFLGGTNSDGAGTPIDVKVSTVPVSPSDCLFNWAEKTYPQQFSPAGATSQTQSTYYYRSYPNTKSYIGISATDNHLYYVGPDGKLQDQGALSNFLTKAGC